MKTETEQVPYCDFCKDCIADEIEKDLNHCRTKLEQVTAQRDELLAACKQFVDYYDQPNRVYQLGNGHASKFFHEVKVAIAKVEGNAK